MSEQSANFPNLHLISSYLVFAFENGALVCQESYTSERTAYEAAAAVGGFVVDAMQITRLHKKDTVPVEEKIHILQMEE